MGVTEILSRLDITGNVVPRRVIVGHALCQVIGVVLIYKCQGSGRVFLLLLL